MSYTEQVRGVAVAHVEEIRGDLDQARWLLRASRGKVVELERQVKSLEVLLALASGSGDTSDEQPGLTLHDAMVSVLRDQPAQMLRAGDLATEITGRGLYRMRDGRPPESQQIHARVGNYPHLFRREGTFIKLVESAV